MSEKLKGNVEEIFYDDDIVRKFILATLVFAAVIVGVGVIVKLNIVATVHVFTSPTTV